MINKHWHTLCGHENRTNSFLEPIWETAKENITLNKSTKYNLLKEFTVMHTLMV